MFLCRFDHFFGLSLRLKITILITLLTAFLTVSFTAYFVYHERRTYTRQLTKEGELLASMMAANLLIPLYAGSSEEIARQVSEVFKHKSVLTVKVANTDNEQILFLSRKPQDPFRNGLAVKKVIRSEASGQSPEALILGESGETALLGSVELVLDTAPIGVMTQKLITVSTLLAFAFWLVASALSLLLLNRITSTFQLLMGGVKRIEEGDLSVSIPVSSKDEAGRALAAINNMAEALKKRNEENERLQAEVVKGLTLQIDEEKNKHMAKLIQTNRMTSLGLLVSSMAHEINNPNGAIRLAAEILERGFRDIQPVLHEAAEVEGEFKICGVPYLEGLEDIENAVEAIKRSSIRIEWVVQNLRSYSLGDRDKQRIAFDINRVAENAVAIIRAHGKMESVTVNTDLASQLPQAFGNPFQVEQVVVNLLLNAIQAMAVNNGREITISTREDAMNAELLLMVDDSGPGIAPENLPHIFEPFFSTKIDKGGSGLGLYIADFIVKEQSGSLEITNNERGGCRGVIRLPAATRVNLQHWTTPPASYSE